MPQRHRSEISESVSADPLGRDRRTPRTFRPGRQCALPGCETVLSIYNGAKYCAPHDAKPFRVASARVPSPSPPEGTVSATEEKAPAPKVRPRVRVLVDPGGDVSRRAS
jgi:hypothetical protein